MNVLLIVPRNIINDRSKNGIGTYLDGMCTMFDRLNIGYDVIAERPPKTDNFYKYHGTEFVAPEVYHDLSEQIKNLVFSKHYEMIICSTWEGLLSLISMELHKIIPTYYRTHSPPLAYDELSKLQLRMRLIVACVNAEAPYIRLVTQGPRVASNLRSRFNPNVSITSACNFIKNLGVKPSTSDKTEGVLYIARYQDIKNVEDFAKIMAKFGKPVKIMTSSSTSAARWRKLLDAHKVKHDVRYGLKGEAKTAFIASARISVQWSKFEAMSNSPIETLPYCPTFILQSAACWHLDYSDFDFYKHIYSSPESECLPILKEMYAQDTAKYRKKLSGMPTYHENYVIDQWKQVLRSTDKYPNLGRVGKSELAAQLNEGQIINFAEFAKDFMYRKLRQLYCYHYQFGLSTKQSLLRRKRK